MRSFSQRDRDRLAVLRQVRDGLVTAQRGAELVGLTARHFRRLHREWEREGDRAVIHGLRGRRSNRAVANAALLDRIREARRFSREIYGKSRLYAELRESGVLVNHKRVGRLMQEHGIVGATRRRKWRTTKRDRDVRPAPDLVERKFTAEGPDQLWVADITSMPTWSGSLFLAVVVDARSRRVVG